MESFTLTAVITGIVCYVLGLAFGWYVNRSNNASKVQAAYQKGEQTAQKVHETEKKELSGELLERLEQMKDSLISTYEAYEDAVQTVDEKLSPGVKATLTLAHGSSTAAIDMAAIDTAATDAVTTHATTPEEPAEQSPLEEQPQPETMSDILGTSAANSTEENHRPTAY